MSTCVDVHALNPHAWTPTFVLWFSGQHCHWVKRFFAALHSWSSDMNLTGVDSYCQDSFANLCFATSACMCWTAHAGSICEQIMKMGPCYRSQRMVSYTCTVYHACNVPSSHDLEVPHAALFSAHTQACTHACMLKVLHGAGFCTKLWLCRSTFLPDPSCPQNIQFIWGKVSIFQGLGGFVAHSCNNVLLIWFICRHMKRKTAVRVWLS